MSDKYDIYGMVRFCKRSIEIDSSASERETSLPARRAYKVARFMPLIVGNERTSGFGRSISQYVVG